MLNDLINLTHSHEFEEYGTLELAAVRIEGNVMTLSLNLNSGADSDDYQSWEVECVGFLEHELSLGQCEGFDLEYDHILLWNYIYPRVSVSFYGEADNSLAVVGALYKRHIELVGNWIPFDRFMNGNTVEMIRGRYGMLANGPLPLVESYSQVLESFEISTQLTEPKPAYFTNDEFSGLAELEVLILKTGCFVVAPKFNARRLRDAEI
jgi:hypothetical protein